MAWQNKNFAYSTLDGGVLIGASSIVLVDGTVFPASGNFMCVIWDQSYANPSFDSSRELVLCTSRSTHTISVTRAQEGTSAKAWNSGDKVAHVYTAGILDTLVYLTETQTLTNKTLTTPTISSTGFTNANHAHAAANSGGTLNASAIAAGTLVHERGGLEADVSAYNGLVKISGGATSAVTIPSGDLVGTTATQSLSNKTLTTPTISLPAEAALVMGTDWTATNAYCVKDSMGFVHLRGSAIATSDNADYTWAGFLPSGYYPSATQDFLIERWPSDGLLYYARIDGTGTITLEAHDSFAALTNTRLFFAGVTFKAA